MIQNVLLGLHEFYIYQFMETTEEANSTTDRAIEILLSKLEEAKARNPRLSMRAFAQRIGMSSGGLSEILSGKRAFTASIKKKVAEKLMLSPQEQLEFFSNDLPGKMKIQTDSRSTLSQDQFHLISDWWYFGLLNLLKTKGFKNSTRWMAQRLGVSENVASEAWERLFRLGYLEKKGNQVVRKGTEIRTTDNLLDLSIRKSHIQDLKLIENSLMEVPLDQRDNTSCTFVIDKADIPKAKEMIRIFQSQIVNQLGKDTGNEVYKISVALYPLTQVSREQ
ncbi:MAG: TIGR02147 family protein [Pseudobdellovibrionaceae bacterium]